MKTKVSRNTIKNSFKNCIEVGYCDLQHLLTYRNANFYTCGVYGWNADIYVINADTCLVTGYRTFGNIRPSHETIRKWDEYAKSYLDSVDWKTDYKTKLNQLDVILADFIRDVTK